MLSRPRLGYLSIGVATIPNKNTLFVTLVDLIPRFEAHRGQFFLPNSIDSLCLRVAQMPESREVVIFWTTTTTPRPITLPPCACARGNKDHNGVTGNGRQTCKFYDKLDAVLGYRPASTPPVLLDAGSSTVPSTSTG
jgi:hypothetical protein